MAYKEAGLNEEAAQRLNENREEFQTGLKELIRRCSLANQFANCMINRCNSISGNALRILPQWNASTRELTVDDILVKAYRQPAKTQELLLNVFQEQRWERHILDPLPWIPSVELRQARLRDVVRRLNNQRVKIIVFARDGNGEGIIWSWTNPAAPGKPAF